MWVSRRFGQNRFDNPSGELARALVLLQHDGDLNARAYILAVASIRHSVSPFATRIEEQPPILPELISIVC